MTARMYFRSTCPTSRIVLRSAFKIWTSTGQRRMSLWLLSTHVSRRMTSLWLSASSGINLWKEMVSDVVESQRSQSGEEENMTTEHNVIDTLNRIRSHMSTTHTHILTHTHSLIAIFLVTRHTLYKHILTVTKYTHHIRHQTLQY